MAETKAITLEQLHKRERDFYLGKTDKLPFQEKETTVEDARKAYCKQVEADEKKRIAKFADRQSKGLSQKFVPEVVTTATTFQTTVDVKLKTPEINLPNRVDGQGNVIEEPKAPEKKDEPKKS